MSSEAPEKLRIIAYKEDGGWMAQCLEHDISAQGPDFDTAMTRLRTAVNVEESYTRRELGAPFEGIESAPKFFFDMFDSAVSEMLLKCDSGQEADLRIAA